MQETLDGIAELREAGGIRPGGDRGQHDARGGTRQAAGAAAGPALGSKTRDTHALEVALKAAGLGDDADLAADLAAELADEAGRPARSGPSAASSTRPGSRATSCR